MTWKQLKLRIAYGIVAIMAVSVVIGIVMAAWHEPKAIMTLGGTALGIWALYTVGADG